MNKFCKSIVIPSLVLTLAFESFFAVISPVLAKADDLVIEDNGSVVLVLSDSVIAIQTAKDPKNDPPSKADPPATTSKVIVPAKVSSTVSIDPKPSSDNKVKITVSSQGKTQLPTTPSRTSPPKTAAPGTTSAPTPAQPAAPLTTVDKVVLDGANQKPIITISGEKSKNLNIEQGGQNVSTNLPIKVINKTDQTTGAVSHELQAGSSPLSVLPDVAVKAAEQQMKENSLPVVKKEVTLSNISVLGNPTAQPNYIVKEERKGKLFGVFGVTVKSEVEISGQSGITNSTWQSPFSFLVF